MLFNIEKDSYEQHDLAGIEKAICRDAVYCLSEWHDEMMGTMHDAVDPMWTVIREGGPFHARGQLRNYCEQLEKTGRAHAIPELKRRHPYEFE